MPHRAGGSDLRIDRAGDSPDAHQQGYLGRYRRVTIATTAMADCKAKGYKVSAVVVGRVGEIIVQVRGDGTGPHTMENAFKKAFTSRTFRIPSGEMEKRLKDNPQMGAQFLTGFTTARGGLPIKIGEDVVGAAAVSGAPGGEKDEACVQTGLDKVQDQLK